MSKRTVVAVASVSASVVLASIALGTALAHRAAKLAAPKPGVHSPLPLAMVCEQAIVYDESCTYGAAKNLGDPVTSTCRFTLDCCGAVVQSWDKSFRSEEGRGRFGHIHQQLTFSCKATPTDVDQDGIANYDDEYPAEPLTPTVAIVANAPAATATPEETATPTPTPEPAPEIEFEIGSVNR